MSIELAKSPIIASYVICIIIYQYIIMYHYC